MLNVKRFQPLSTEFEKYQALSCDTAGKARLASHVLVPVCQVLKDELGKNAQGNGGINVVNKESDLQRLEPWKGHQELANLHSQVYQTDFFDSENGAQSFATFLRNTRPGRS